MSKPAPSRAATDAIALLEKDHAEVKSKFKQYEKLVDADASDDQKKTLALDICAALTAHATVEEELFYPAARDVLDEEDLVDEATVEHASAKDLIAQIQAMNPSDDLYDAKVKVLGEYIEHHVKEEENEMFPKVRKSGIDLAVLAVALQSRKDELLREPAKV